MASAADTADSVAGVIALAVLAMVLIPVTQVLVDVIPPSSPFSGAVSLLRLLPFVFGVLVVIILAVTVFEKFGQTF